jgi:CPA2 family monovalent cation:H+ antiporter-2
MILLKDIIVILFLAVVIIYVAAKLKIPSIIGFLLTGILIGPSVLNLVKTASEIEILAEIGIVILMFTIGLEFSLSKIKTIKKYFFLFGGLQVILSWIGFSLLLSWYGLQFQQLFIGGFILALSSTAIVLKLLQDQNTLNTPSGLKMTGILLFQDVAIIPFLILLPSLSQLNLVLSLTSLLQLMLPIGGVVIVFFLSRIIFPKIFSLIVHIRIPELLMVTVFVLMFGTAFITHKLGASMAIGAFIAGAAISDCDYAHQINTEIMPSRHVFNSIFFVSIGMFVNLPYLFSHFLEVIILTVVIVAIKCIVILFIFIISRHPLNEGFIAAFGLAHIGEFSFILLKLSQDQNLLSQDFFRMLISATVLSMFSIPFALKIGKRIAGYQVFKKKTIMPDKSESLKNHTIIAGFGLNGQNISRILKLLDIPYTILDINPATVSKYKTLGESIHYGDIDREDNLRNLSIEKASLLVIAISDMNACLRAIMIARKANPDIKIIARSNFLTQVEDMYKLGADLVLSQDMETSLIFIHHILKFYHMPDHIARIQTNLLRKEHYQFFMKEDFREAWKVAIFDYIEQDNELFFVAAASNHVSKKIGKLKPFSYDDMKIIGIIRHNEMITASLKDLVIEPYDTLIFSGNHEQVTRALQWMEDNN